MPCATSHYTHSTSALVKTHRDFTPLSPFISVGHPLQLYNQQIPLAHIHTNHTVAPTLHYYFYSLLPPVILSHSLVFCFLILVGYLYPPSFCRLMIHFFTVEMREALVVLGSVLFGRIFGGTLLVDTTKQQKKRREQGSTTWDTNLGYERYIIWTAMNISLEDWIIVCGSTDLMSATERMILLSVYEDLLFSRLHWGFCRFRIWDGLWILGIFDGSEAHEGLRLRSLLFFMSLRS